jgi:hypothetical protein
MSPIRGKDDAVGECTLSKGEDTISRFKFRDGGMDTTHDTGTFMAQQMLILRYNTHGNSNILQHN